MSALRIRTLKIKGIEYPFEKEADIVELHDLIIKSFGGASGVVVEGCLTQAVNEVIDLGDRTSHEDTIINKASSLLFNIIHGHPFVDGNKRTGLVVTEAFLSINGYLIDEKEDNLYNLSLKVASAYETDDRKFRGDIKKWLKKHIKKKKI